MGPVADYFAYRWSDPTYLAGLALIEAHWTQPSTAFELACGIGHYLRELTRAGVACLGADVVFAKCWLAKHWVAPAADYVVFDAAAAWPVAEQRFDLVMCHDAFYFLPDQPRVAERLRDATAPGGVLAVSHLHNVGVAGGAKGPARSGAEWHALFPTAQVHDERALLCALMKQTAPPTTDWRDAPVIEAWSLVEGGGEPRAITGGVAMPAEGATLRRNPLIGDDGEVEWPSPRYRDEYAAGCFWALSDDALRFDADDVRLRRVVDLPERW
nr:class I SAM-dependent methyltransferase [Sphingomonas hominis]